MSVSLPALVLGGLIGLTYGALAVGMVLVYRANRIVNFAHAQIGAFAASMMALAVLRWHVPYWLALPPALLVGAGTGALAEVVIVRRLASAPRVMTVVATLGLGQFLLLLALAVNPDASTGITFPKPAGVPSARVGGLFLSPSYLAMAVLVPLAAAGLSAFLVRSRYGVGIRAAAQNPDAARLSGLSARRMSSLSWGIAGALSALTAVLVIPTQGAAAAASFGPSLLLRALAAAVIARLASLPLALLAGVGLGLVEAVVASSTSSYGVIDPVLFGVILVAVLVQRPLGGREAERGQWSSVVAWPPLPARVRAWREVRFAPAITAGVVVVLLMSLTVVGSNSTAFRMTTLLSVTVVGLSVGIITGLAGQLSLGQLAVAGVGAAVCFHVVYHSGNYPLGFLLAGLAGAVTSVLLGIPALRVRGLMLAVTTLAFALAAEQWLLRQPAFLSNGVEPGRPIVGSWVADSSKRYYGIVVGVFVLVTWLCWNIRRGGLGRTFVAVRDGEAQARAFGIRAWRVKLLAYALAGFVAGVGGAAYGHLFSTLSYSNFRTDAIADPSSIGVVALTVIGGIGLLVGPLLGALYIVGVPQFLPLDSAGLAASSLGWLLLLLYAPGGIAALFRPVRDWLARGAEDAPEVEAHTQPARLEPRVGSRPRTGRLAVQVRGVSKRYGGVVALDRVDLDVRQGEVLGLIGPNGAGKTTLFEVIGGFSRPDEGSVLVAGQDVTRRGPEHRAGLGLVRSFQDAPLFPTLSVLDTVRVALEKDDPTRLVPSLLGLGAAERRRTERAQELLALMGLQRWRDVPVSSLSTGTRRIAELACLVALAPEVLLLDEPSSGIAQRESEALGEVIRGIARHLDATVVVIEHDIPLLASLSDRMVAMESGRVLVSGTPDEVLTDDRVVHSYLGGDPTAVRRSDAPAGAALAGAGMSLAARSASTRTY